MAYDPPAGALAGFDTVDAADVIAAQFRQPMGTSEARVAMLEGYLRSHGPVSTYDIANSTGWPMGSSNGTCRSFRPRARPAVVSM